jgi:hypothetical protein
MRSKPQKKSKSRSTPKTFLRPDILDSRKRLKEENFMTMQIQKADTLGSEANGVDSMFNIFARNEDFWWPFRAVSKALLQTQQNSKAYLEANRHLIDEMQNIMRKEQNLVFELSETALNTVCKIGMRTDRNAPLERGEMSEVFDRAMSGVRELGKAWIDAQVRSLDVMRADNEAGHGKSEIDSEAEAKAA